jgi:hypothetical protein
MNGIIEFACFSELCKTTTDASIRQLWSRLRTTKKACSFPVKFNRKWLDGKNGFVSIMDYLPIARDDALPAQTCPTYPNLQASCVLCNIQIPLQILQAGSTCQSLSGDVRFQIRCCDMKFSKDIAVIRNERLDGQCSTPASRLRDKRMQI